MLESIDLMEFEIIVAPEFRVASSHGVGDFQQIVAEISVAGLDETSCFRLKLTGLVLRPDKACVLGDRGLRIKTADLPISAMMPAE